MQGLHNSTHQRVVGPETKRARLSQYCPKFVLLSNNVLHFPYRDFLKLTRQLVEFALAFAMLLICGKSSA